MTLKDFTRDYHMRQAVKNVAVCIYRKPDDRADSSHINKTLRLLQKELAGRREKVFTAFVFGQNTSDARDFEEADENVVYEADNVKKAAPLSHIWLMGMALLEKKDAEDRKAGLEPENTLCLVTDESLSRTENDKILFGMENRFFGIKVKPVLIRDRNSSGGRLEEYIRENGEVCTV